MAGETPRQVELMEKYLLAQEVQDTLEDDGASPEQAAEAARKRVYEPRDRKSSR